jgi:hypothetical protein
MIANIAKDAGLTQTTPNAIVHRSPEVFARIRKIWPECGAMVRIKSRLPQTIGAEPEFRLVDETGRSKAITAMDVIRIKGG